MNNFNCKSKRGFTIKVNRQIDILHNNNNNDHIFRWGLSSKILASTIIIIIIIIIITIIIIIIPQYAHNITQQTSVPVL